MLDFERLFPHCGGLSFARRLVVAAGLCVGGNVWAQAAPVFTPPTNQVGAALAEGVTQALVRRGFAMNDPRITQTVTAIGSGTSCDMVIMIQDLTSLHRFVRGVLESSFKFTKLKSIGLSSKYRFEVYEGRRQTRSSLVTASVKSYDKKIFPLYKSYDGDKGREQVVDDRQNLFKNKWFVASMAIALAGLLFASWWFVGWISKMRSGGTENHPQGIQPANVSSQQPSSPIGTSNRSLSEVSRLPDLSADARLVAVLEPSKGEVVVVLQSSDGRYIRQRMNAGVVDGWQSVAGYQGRMVGFVFGGKSK